MTHIDFAVLNTHVTVTLKDLSRRLIFMLWGRAEEFEAEEFKI